MKTSDAADIQQRLADLGYYADLVDGYWGPNSRRALLAFKIARGLPANDAFTAEVEATLAYSTVRASGLLSTPLPGSYAPTLYPPPTGATLNPLNQRDATRLQQRLASLSFYYGAGDGVWGEASHQALQDFRYLNGLGRDDTWDAATERALLSASATSAPGSIIGIWSANTAQCTTPNVPNPYQFRLGTWGIESGDTTCHFTAVSRVGTTWTAQGICTDQPSAQQSFTFTASGANLTYARQTYRRCPLP